MAKPKQQKQAKRGRKSGNPHRKNKYKSVQPGRTRKNKDRNVCRHTHGKFATVAELEAHRMKVVAKRQKETKNE